jgi:hypothetical protein
MSRAEQSRAEQSRAGTLALALMVSLAAAACNRGYPPATTVPVFPIAAEQCFARSVFFSAGTASLGPAITAADVTHDGLQDVVVGSFGVAGGRVDILPAIPGTGLSTGGVYTIRQPTIL